MQKAGLSNNRRVSTSHDREGMPVPIDFRRSRESFSRIGGGMTIGSATGHGIAVGDGNTPTHGGHGAFSTSHGLSWSGSWWNKEFPVDFSCTPKNGAEMAGLAERNIDDEFCKNFICCGTELADMYELQQHYEDHHVKFAEMDDDNLNEMLSEDSAEAETAEGVTPMVGGKPDLRAIKQRAMFCMSDIFQSLDQLDSVSAFETAVLRSNKNGKRQASHSHHHVHMQTSSNHHITHPEPFKANFERTHTIESTPYDTPDSSIPSTPISLADIDILPTAVADLSQIELTDDVARQTMNVSDMQSPASGVGSASLFGGIANNANKKARITTIPISPQFGQPQQTSPDSQNGSISQQLSSQHPMPIEYAPSSIAPEATVAMDKPYRCKNYGCDKAYKNMNGLKYHRLHGACNTNNLPPPTQEELDNAAEAEEEKNGEGMKEGEGISRPNSPFIADDKKYRCEKCNKRYKNLNGLKYHRKTSHIRPFISSRIPCDFPTM